MARVNGKALSLEVATDEWKGEVRSWKLDSADKADPTFEDAENGASDWTLSLTVEQDMGAASAFRYLWDHAGDSGVACVLAPYGNATPSVAQPHLSFTVTIPRKPGLGGEAAMSNTAYTTDVDLLVDSEPTLVTA